MIDHEFEQYLQNHNTEHSLCKVGSPHSNGKLERFFQTYEKHRWRFDTLDKFPQFYNEVRPYMNLLGDELETPAEAFNRLLAMPEDDFEEALTDGVIGDEQSSKSLPYKSV